MKHFLFNLSDALVKDFEVFDKDAIKAEIVKYLTANPNEELTHEKELNPSDKKKYVGNEIINFYKCNKSGIPSKIISKGTKEYYQPLI
jgi:hypothetical protein